MKKIYTMFLALVLASIMGHAQNVAIIATPVTTDPDVYDANVMAIQGMIEDAWSGITTEFVRSAALADYNSQNLWATAGFDAIVVTENGGSGAMGNISPTGIRTAPLLCLKAYAIRRNYPQWNLITSSAGTWYQMPKPDGIQLDSSGADYERAFYGTVAVEHPIFGGFWGEGEEFQFTTNHDENQGKEAHIQCFELDSSSAPVAAASTMIATNNFAVNETTSAVDGWLWTIDEVADSGYHKTVIWGVHHAFMANVTDNFRVILQNSLAWALDHEIPNQYVNAVENEETQAFHLGVYPNPVTSEANIIFRLDQTMDITLNIIDAVGRVVYSQSGLYGAGSQQIILDASGFAAGVYVCRLSANGMAQNRVLIVE